MSDNIYSAPEAELTKTGGEKFTILPRFSTQFVFLLTIVSFGIYPVYWMYSRSKKINLVIPENKISNVFIVTCPLLVVLSFVLGFAAGIMEETGSGAAAGVSAANAAVSLIYWGFCVAWAFTIADRLELIARSEKMEWVNIGKVGTFFLSTLYLNYKINQILDSLSENVNKDA